jgi:hypothetical protein
MNPLILYNNFVDVFQKLTDKQKVLFASHWAQSEIMNGGLGQFFANKTGGACSRSCRGI